LLLFEALAQLLKNSPIKTDAATNNITIAVDEAPSIVASKNCLKLSSL